MEHNLVTLEKLLLLRESVQNEDSCAKLLQDRYPAYAACKLDSLRRKIGSEIQKLKTLKRSKTKSGPNYESRIKEQFKPPISRIEHMSDQLQSEQQEIAKKIVSHAQNVVSENRDLKRQYNESENYCNELEKQIEILEIKLNNSLTILGKLAPAYDKINEKHDKEKSELKIQLTKCDKEYSQLSSEVEHITQELSKAKEKLSQSNVRNLNKKLKRKCETVSVLKEKLDTQNKELKSLKEENENLWGHVMDIECNLNENQSDKSDGRNEHVYFQKKISKLNCQIKNLKEEKKTMIAEKETAETEYDKQISEYQKQIADLEQVINLMESDTIKTFSEGRYTNEIRQCCMALLTECNISLNKLPHVIRTVLKSLTGKVAERLPSKTLLSWLMTEAKVVASRQVSEAMLKDFDATDSHGITLHQDATTKYHQHYEGFQVTLKSGDSLSMGLKLVGGGDADTYYKAFCDTVDDLSMSMSSSQSDEDMSLKRAKLICSIRNYMSDLAATNGKLNESLDKIRKELMPKVIPNFNDLSQEEQNDILLTGKFACRLHLLANFGTSCDKALGNLESSICDGQNPHSYKQEGSGTFRLARTAAKALTKRGSDKAGVAPYWEAFLKGKGKTNKLVTFHGHRINIAFHDCAALYFHRDDIREFFFDWPEPNQLLKSVIFDIKENVYLAGCRAMGILDKLVTTPFWNILEKDGSILDLNPYLYKMKCTLEKWSENGAIPLSGELMFPDEKLKKDELYDSLFAETNSVEFDAMTQMFLELLCTQMLLLLERQASSQLPGGEYWDAPVHVQEISSTVPKTNAISERDMAVLDNLLKTKPSASSLTLEVLVMCTKNKPFSAWMGSLSQTEIDKILDDARIIAPRLSEKMKERKIALEEQIKLKYQEKKQKTENKEQKEINLKVKYTKEVSEYGGVWTASDIDGKLGTIKSQKQSDNEKNKHVRSAILCQIKFHKNVLKSKGPREIFQEQLQGKKYSNDELEQNLRRILLLNKIQDNDTDCSTGLTYKPIQEVSTELVSKKGAIWKQVHEARVKRQIDQCKTELPKFLEDPSLLVGRAVKHKCVVDEAGERVIEWFEGRVCSIKKANKDTLKTEFNIKYTDSDEMWFFPLLVDLK